MGFNVYSLKKFISLKKNSGWFSSPIIDRPFWSQLEENPSPRKESHFEYSRGLY